MSAYDLQTRADIETAKRVIDAIGKSIARHQREQGPEKTLTEVMAAAALTSAYIDVVLLEEDGK